MEFRDQRGKEFRLWLTTLLMAGLCFALLLALPLQAQERTPPRQKTESPYFLVSSDDPSLDRLPLKRTAVDVRSPA